MSIDWRSWFTRANQISWQGVDVPFDRQAEFLVSEAVSSTEAMYQAFKARFIEESGVVQAAVRSAPTDAAVVAPDLVLALWEICEKHKSSTVEDALWKDKTTLNKLLDALRPHFIAHNAAPATLTKEDKRAAVDALYSGCDNLAPLRWDALEGSLNALLERFEVRPKP
jgi:hypothetical protein